MVVGEVLAVGRELFERVWVKNDPRGHRGDGLGPVFNGQSCVGCHNLGGTGGAGGADRNIEIVTAADNVGDYTGYSYLSSMDFGAGKFEYRFGGDPPRRRVVSFKPTRDSWPRFIPALPSRAAWCCIAFGTDPMYNAWRELVPGQHGSILIRSSQRNPPPLFGAGLIDAISDEAIEAAAKRKPAGSARPRDG